MFPFDGKKTLNLKTFPVEMVASKTGKKVIYLPTTSAFLKEYNMREGQRRKTTSCQIILLSGGSFMKRNKEFGFSFLKARDIFSHNF